MRSWESLRGVQEQLEGEEEAGGGPVKEEQLSDLLSLQRRVKDKIQQSQSVLDLTSSFHLTAKQVGQAVLSGGNSEVLSQTIRLSAVCFFLCPVGGAAPH